MTRKVKYCITLYFAKRYPLYDEYQEFCNNADEMRERVAAITKIADIAFGDRFIDDYQIDVTEV